MKSLNETQSICPVCRKPVKAEYTEEDDRVFYTIRCPEHGETRTLVAANASDYINWMDNPVVNIPPKVNITQGKNEECPLHCGTCENHLQTACCVLIDVTNRCNQHCPYCFATARSDSENSGSQIHEPSLDEIERKYDLLLELGEEREFNIQISGGEPTVRDDLPDIISLGKQKGFEYIQLNSNGKRIAEEDGYAQILKDAGTSVVFMQFDGTNDEIYMKLRNEPLKRIKEKAVENCRQAGLPVALVPTIVRDINLDNIGSMMSYLLDNVDVVKGIHFQPVSYFGRYPDDNGRVTMFDVLHELEKQTSFFKYEDFCPISSGHQLCCFYSTYLKEDENVVCQLSEETKKNGVTCCETDDPLTAIKKDRDYVLNKWEMAPLDPGSRCCCDSNEQTESTCCCGNPAQLKADEPMDFDEFLNQYQQNTFTVTGMAFQDVTNLDAERLKRCRVVQLTEDDRLIPFCAYNSIYREVF